MGTISMHRNVRVLAVGEHSHRGLLVRDAEEVEYDLMSNFDCNLEFDRKRSTLDGCALDEHPEDTAGAGEECVVQMLTKLIGGCDTQVIRSSVWVKRSSWDAVPLQ